MLTSLVNPSIHCLLYGSRNRLVMTKIRTSFISLEFRAIEQFSGQCRTHDRKSWPILLVCNTIMLLENSLRYTFRYKLSVTKIEQDLLSSTIVLLDLWSRNRVYITKTVQNNSSRCMMTLKNQFFESNNKMCGLSLNRGVLNLFVRMILLERKTCIMISLYDNHLPKMAL